MASKVALRARAANAIPAEILNNEQLKGDISKSVWQLKKNKVHRGDNMKHLMHVKGSLLNDLVALQFPEGLLLYACPISDILQKYADVETVVMGDVTYGACCIDDYTAIALDCDYMIHYGHSCLVPIDVTNLKVLYVFVDILIDITSLIHAVRNNFTERTRIALVSTIQFVSSLPAIKSQLEKFYTVVIPQSKPLSPGEILGCTAPKVDTDALIYIGDGRFHLEAMMISNPAVPAYKFDPYSSTILREHYDFKELHKTRQLAIETAKSARVVGLILSTLGRQGSPSILDNIKKRLDAKNIKHVTVLLSELSPTKLAKFDHVDAWIQVACPRISIDWGYAFDKPVLSPYEAAVALNAIEYQESYPMDYYAKSSLGNWTNYHPESVIDASKKS